VKSRKENIRLRELFRKKLEYAEIMPDASVNSKLMRKLAVKEFLHFYPARFNIYYLGGILVAGIAVGILLSDNNENKDQNKQIINPPETVRTENTSVSIEKQVYERAEQLPVSVKKPSGGKIPSGSDDLKAVESEGISNLREKNRIAYVAVNDSFAKNSIFSASSDDKKNLQSRKSSDNIFIKSSVNEGCAPLNVKFYNLSTGFDSCRWTFGDGGSSSDINPEWIFDVDGEYNVVLKVFCKNEVIKTYETHITGYPKPTARFEISPDNAIIPDDQISFHNYSTGGVRYNWALGDGNTSELFEPLHRYERFGNYNVTLKVYSEYGCSDSMIVNNAFAGSGYFISFPNAFIPNSEGPTGGLYSLKSDEVAEVFHPSSSGVSAYQLKIFSKMGILIFESNDLNIGWDGYLKGQLSNPGVYIWKVRGKFSNGESFVKMGDVTLLQK